MWEDNKINHNVNYLQARQWGIMRSSWWAGSEGKGGTRVEFEIFARKDLIGNVTTEAGFEIS